MREAATPLEEAMMLLARLPGLGRVSSRRIMLALLKKRHALLKPLIKALARVESTIAPCPQCGMLAMHSPCEICRDPKRDRHIVCVVEDMGDVWALEATGFRGLYHVLGGLISPLDGVHAEDLSFQALLVRLKKDAIKEVVLALSATIDGQATLHYASKLLLEDGCARVSRLGTGLPVGGEIDYLDQATLTAAMSTRHDI